MKTSKKRIAEEQVLENALNEVLEYIEHCRLVRLCNFRSSAKAAK